MSGDKQQGSKATAKRSTDTTVFVRFVPPTSLIRRHHLEDVFSEIGPIKKSSVICPPRPKETGRDEHPPSAGTSAKASSSYGFVRYTCAADAQQAAAKLNHRILVVDGEKVQVKVELASVATSGKRRDVHNNDHTDQKAPRGKEVASRPVQTQSSMSQSPPASSKHHRLIIRNLSFYAKESHIRKALQEFGALEEVHIPKVRAPSRPTNDADPTTHLVTHRGFAFVTFANPQDAQACLDSVNANSNVKKSVKSSPLIIHQRPVSVAYALNKTAYETRKQQSTDSAQAKPKLLIVSEQQMDDERKHQIKDNEGDKSQTNASDRRDSNEADQDGPSDASEHDSDNDQDSDNNSESSDNTNVDMEQIDSKEVDKEKAIVDESAVTDKRSLFLRNLPFDATRHDLFQVFRTFGFVSGIYIVKDKETGMPKGTAFVTFRENAGAQSALDASQDANDASFVSLKESGSAVGGGIVVKGRRLLVDLAVDKDTASTITMEKQADTKVTGKDRRSLYLKGEGRVDNDANSEHKAWDVLPEMDQQKRQRAWADKITKLRSPLFFINPVRLSVRNLAKHVDESQLKNLCVQAIQRGLQKRLVTPEDQIAHWRSAGDLPTREILKRMEEAGGDPNGIVPSFDDANVKKYIRSVFIDRDFTTNKKDKAPSRGFGFVEFEHHAHALACLRELNNNPYYTEEHVQGGKGAVESKRKSHKKKRSQEGGIAKIPRLILEFTVENKAKARQQLEHRAQQQANLVKQKMIHKEQTANEEKQPSKKSRGALQRDKKRKQREQSDGTSPSSPELLDEVAQSTKKQTQVERVERAKNKTVKPLKKRKKKVDKEEENFSKMVETYKQTFAGSADTATTAEALSEKDGKRWFE